MPLGPGFPGDLSGDAKLIGFALAGIAVDGNGNLYVATGSDLRKLSPTGVSLAVWKPTTAGSAHFGAYQVALGADGTVYATGLSIRRSQNQFEEQSLPQVVKLSPDGTVLAKWGGAGRQPGKFGSPMGIAVGAGSIFAADPANDRITALSTTGEPQAIWGNTNTSKPLPTRFAFPHQLAVTHQGTVYFSGGDQERILKLDRSGRTNFTWRIHPNGRTLFIPLGLSVDTRSHVYIGDIGGNRVLELSTQGRLLRSWPMVRVKTQFPGGRGAFSLQPISLSLDPHGTIYVIDNESSLYWLDRRTAHWTRVIQGGNTVKSPDNIGAAAVDGRGRIFTVDKGRIQIFAKDGRRRARKLSGRA